MALISNYLNVLQVGKLVSWDISNTYSVQFGTAYYGGANRSTQTIQINASYEYVGLTLEAANRFCSQRTATWVDTQGGFPQPSDGFIFYDTLNPTSIYAQLTRSINGYVRENVREVGSYSVTLNLVTVLEFSQSGIGPAGKISSAFGARTFPANITYNPEGSATYMQLSAIKYLEVDNYKVSTYGQNTSSSLSITVDKPSIALAYKTLPTGQPASPRVCLVY